jgi:hypothetical protein
MTILLVLSAAAIRSRLTLAAALFRPLAQTGSNPICAVYTALQAWALPLAFVGLLVVFLIWIARPLAPELYAQQQGAIRSVAIGVAGVALTPAIVAFLATTFNLSNSAACS